MYTVLQQTAANPFVQRDYMSSHYYFWYLIDPIKEHVNMIGDKFIAIQQHILDILSKKLQ